MEEKWILVCLVVVMFCGSYLSGIVPLSLKFSEDKLKKITVFGAGLLVGTALAVIIPEGVRSLVVESGAHANNVVSNALAEETHKHDQEHALSVIGYCLILGFIFMLIVDQLSQRRNHNLNTADRNITATIGLVVHAAADGVALGAAATTSHHDVEIIVFLAIMLHKAPAAFGLVTYLLHEGIERSRIKRHLLIFSLSAPALTVVTYLGIGQKGSEALSSLNATGIAMLFSAGTFLYVATVHVLADLTQNTHDTQYSRISNDDGTYSRYPNVEAGLKNPQAPPPLKALTLTELVILAVGCLTPLVLTMGHRH